MDEMHFGASSVQYIACIFTFVDIFNHAQFNPPALDRGQTSFGRITGSSVNPPPKAFVVLRMGWKPVPV